ncbi:hypothetical protein E2C01_009078 [Portunus trituberculatus]|uniref:Uncharacterized protein n=1 Tax=Portunus trituberculatus TaxID=210409 RepID=A0A5B7D2H6_PORTR|nr:hypothetical protein [Portunus trituberculatus]
MCLSALLSFYSLSLYLKHCSFTLSSATTTTTITTTTITTLFFPQGVRPQSFLKIEDEDVKYIVDWCTRLHNAESRREEEEKEEEEEEGQVIDTWWWKRRRRRKERRRKSL